MCAFYRLRGFRQIVETDGLNNTQYYGPAEFTEIRKECVHASIPWCVSNRQICQPNFVGLKHGTETIATTGSCVQYLFTHLI